MKLTRRSFLTLWGIAAATSAVKTKPAIGESQRLSSNLQDWSVVRDQFDLTREYIHMSSFFIASHPRPVRDAIEKHRHEIDRNPLQVVEHGLFGPESESMTRKVKVAAAKYLQTSSDQLALTSNTTTGLALIYHGLKLKPGQEILTTAHDHYSHHESIRLAADKSGASVKKISLFDSYDSITEDGIVSRILGAIKPNTRAVGITWVHSSSGLKLPIRKIADGIADLNRNRSNPERILLIVDGVHGIGVENETMDSLGMDVFSAGTHKWIFGPRGTGIVWAKNTAWEQLTPTIPTFDGTEPYDAWMDGKAPGPPTQASWVTPGGFYGYEHQWALAEAFQFHLDIGKSRVQERIHALNAACKEGLTGIRGVRVITPRDPKLSAGIICLEVGGKTAEQVVDFLHTKKILASTSPYAVSFARVAPSLVNTPEEVEKTVNAIRDFSRT